MQKNRLHQFSAKQIQAMLKDSAWQAPRQIVSSAETNTIYEQSEKQQLEFFAAHPQENTSGVVAFSDIPFREKTRRVLDIGGGKSDQNVQYLAGTKQIQLLVWDPFNRSQEHNAKVKASIQQQQADAATSMSILNVIENIEARLAHIVTVKQATKIDGFCYFKVWSGEGKERGTGVSTKTATCYQANAPAKRFISEVKVVFGAANVYLHPKVPNLIVARKCSEASPSIEVIDKIRLASMQSVMNQRPTANSFFAHNANDSALQEIPVGTSHRATHLNY